MRSKWFVILIWVTITHSIIRIDASPNVAPSFDVGFGVPESWKSLDHKEWFTEDGKLKRTYVIYPMPLTWEAANENAINAGGHLATITSEEENLMVRSAGAAFYQYWIGGIQNVNNSDPLDDWNWVTGELWAYQNWSETEPNDYHGDERYISTYSTGVWLDFLERSSQPSCVEFYPKSSYTVREDEGEFIQNYWIKNISVGPSEESDQTYTLTITADQPQFFSIQPSLSREGTLTFTTAPNAFGTTVLTVTMSDNGGTENGGIDTTIKNYTLTIENVNDAPTIVSKHLFTDEDSSLHTDLIGESLDNDPLSYEVLTQPVYGKVLLNQATATYTPPSNFHGSDQFTYQAFDGELYSEPATVRIGINNSSNSSANLVSKTYTLQEDTQLYFLISSDDTASVSAEYTTTLNGILTVTDNLNLETLYDATFYSLSSDPDLMDLRDQFFFEFEVRPEENGIILDNGVLTCRFHYGKVRVQMDTSAGRITVDSSRVDDGKFHKIGVLIADGQLSLYVNDMLQTSKAIGNILPGSALSLGADIFGNGGYKGSLRNVIIRYELDQGLDSGELLMHSVDGSGLNTQGRLFVFNGGFNRGYPMIYEPHPNYYGSDNFLIGLIDRDGLVPDMVIMNLEVESVNDLVEVEDIRNIQTLQNTPVTLPEVVYMDVEDSPVSLVIVDAPINGDVLIEGLVMTYMPHQDHVGTDTFTFTLNDDSDNGHSAKAEIYVIERYAGEQLLEFNDQEWFSDLNGITEIQNSGNVGASSFQLSGNLSDSYDGVSISYVESGGSALSFTETSDTMVHLLTGNATFEYGNKFTLEARVRYTNIVGGLDLIQDVDELTGREALRWSIDEKEHLELSLNDGSLMVRSANAITWRDVHGWTYLRMSVDLTERSTTEGIAIYDGSGNTMGLSSSESIANIFLASTYTPAKLLQRRGSFAVEVDFIRVLTGIEELPSAPTATNFHRGEVYVDEGASVSILIPGADTFNRVRLSMDQLEELEFGRLETLRDSGELYDRHPNPIGVFHGVFEFRLALETESFDGTVFVDAYLKKPGEDWKKVAEMESRKPTFETNVWWISHFWNSREPGFDWDDFDAQPYVTDEEVLVKYVVR